MGFFSDKPPKYEDSSLDAKVTQNIKQAWLDAMQQEIRTGTLSPANAAKTFEALNNITTSAGGLISFSELVQNNHARIHPADLPELINTSLSMFLGRHQFIKERLPNFFIDELVPLFGEAGVDFATTTELDWRLDTDMLTGMPCISVRITNKYKEYKSGVIYLPERLMSQLQTLAKAGEYK